MDEGFVQPSATLNGGVPPHPVVFLSLQQPKELVGNHVEPPAHLIWGRFMVNKVAVPFLRGIIIVSVRPSWFIQPAIHYVRKPREKPFVKDFYGT